MAKSSSLSEYTMSFKFLCNVGLFDCEFLKCRNYMLVFVVFGLEGLSPIGAWNCVVPVGY